MKDTPNIIFIVLDTVRKKSLSCYGNKRMISPNLDSFAEESVLYTNVYSSACWTQPVHASFFTGLYPSQHGTHGRQLNLLREDIALPGILKENGYRTIGFSSNYLISDVFNMNVGFDEFYQMWQLFPQPKEKNFLYNKAFPKEWKGRKLRKLFRIMKLLGTLGKSLNTFKTILNLSYEKIRYIQWDSSFATEKTFRLAKKWIQKKAKKGPYFVFMNLMQAHNQYNPPRFIRKMLGIEDLRDIMDVGRFYAGQLSMSKREWENLKKLYEAEIYYLDLLLGAFFNFLKVEGECNNTMIIVTSDHGEHLGEHGHYNHLFTLYNELIAVPMIVKYPQGFAGRGVDTALRQSDDIYHTILDILSLRSASFNQNYSFLNPKGRAYAVSQLISTEFGLARCQDYYKEFDIKSFKYNYSLMSLVNNKEFKIIESNKGNIEVYNIVEDVGEQLNLYKEDCFRLEIKELMRQLQKAKEDLGYLNSLKEELEYSEVVVKHLEELGYM